MIQIRHALNEDINYWFNLDKYISVKEFSRKINDKMAFVLLENNHIIGVLRYNLFWDSIPFCNIIFIDKKYQNNGYGKILMTFWEEEMKKDGYEIVMTSTSVNENSQHFYRKLGFCDAGGLIINISKYKQPMEIFFIKEI